MFKRRQHEIISTFYEGLLIISCIRSYIDPITLRRKKTLNIDGGISARIIRFPASSPIGLDESTTIESNTKIKSVIKKKNMIAIMHIACTVTKEYGKAIKYNKGNQH